VVVLRVAPKSIIIVVVVVVSQLSVSLSFQRVMTVGLLEDSKVRINRLN